MPYLSSPSTNPGSVWWLPVASQAGHPWWMEADGSGSGASSLSPISLRSSLIWRMALCCCLLFQVTLVVDEERGRCRYLKSADRVRAYQQLIPWWSDGALDWLPVSAGSLLLLAEWRPTPFLPACVSYWRQIQLLFGGYGVQVLRPWRFLHAKWFVPDDDEVQSGRWLIGTQSRFLLSVWGPPCKSQGLVCYVFYFGVLVGALYFHRFVLNESSGSFQTPL
uniref:Uncharacterized protein n=1 Tax=Aegilops tauschii subsp. strangulata TaxID=200361 RepID=A0A453ENB6_AEGTS